MYNIKSVAKLLAMPAVTIRAWERRYNVITPTRSESGHRLYSEQDIEDLRWLKVQTEEKGINISQAVKMLDMMRAKREQTVAPKVEVAFDKSYDGIIEQLYEALISFDAVQAQSLSALGFAMFPFEEMFHQVFVPILTRIGDEWEQGRVTVAQEHFASMFLTQRFYQFMSAFPVNPTLPKVLAFCPQQESHHIGLLLFTLFLRRNGMDVLFLGPNTPEDGVAETIEKQDVKIVAMSLTDRSRVESTAYLIERLIGKFPKLNFVMGGQAFADGFPDFEPWLLDGDHDSWKAWFARMTQRYA